MASFRTLADVNGGGERGNEDKKVVTTYAGGERSGIAIDQPPPPSQAADRLEVYSDGFVMLGRFRPFSDPANKQLWETIKAGQVPDELKPRMQESPDGLVLSVIDKSRTAYSPAPAPAKKTKSPPKFQGAGYTMAANGGSGVVSVDASRNTLRVDPAQPRVTLAFRFSNGQRLQQEFNEQHTTQDVYNYVQQVAPSSQPYQLVVGFPPQPITGKTLRELDNDLIVQRPMS